ncbi:epithelial-stromal interaction protein 1 isoform X2 [Ascaphus truei]|uniref:epithelial-stromal interaction protein 1 isoform X2 n=1 Tax=Ascaphus truei TaxID=8439 RepID=UPI003F5933B5
MNGRGAGAARGVAGRRMQGGYLTGPQSYHPDEEEWGTGRMDQQQNPDLSTVGGSPQQQTAQAPQETQHMGGYVLIPPNESRRSEIQRIANQELEGWERWKEAHRPGPINLTPTKLGGRTTEAAARQKQQLTQHQSKHQKMLQIEEYKKKIKEEEEAKLQKMKDLQRQKADQLEEKRRQQNLQRELLWQEDMLLRNNRFLDQMSLTAANNQTTDYHGRTLTAWGKSHSYKDEQKEEEKKKLQQMKEEQHMIAEALKFTRKQEEEKRRVSHHEDQKRVNNAFLDRLQGQNTMHQSEHFRNPNRWDN